MAAGAECLSTLAWYYKVQKLVKQRSLNLNGLGYTKEEGHIF